MSIRTRIANALLGADKPMTLEDILHDVLTSASGEHINPTSIMSIPRVASCVDILAMGMRMFPLKVYERLPNGDKKRLSSGHIVNLLKRPNPMDTMTEFLERVMRQLAVYRRSFAIKQIVNGEVWALFPIDDPDQVSVTINDDWEYEFEYNGKKYTSAQMLYFKHDDGKAITCNNRDIFGNALAIQKYTGYFFKNSARPSSVIETENEFKDDDARRRFAKLWNDTFSGTENHGKTVILDKGKKYKQISMSNVDAEFLGTAKYIDSQICGVFHVPPHMVADLENGNLSNVRNLRDEFADTIMNSWCMLIQKRLTMEILEPFRKYKDCFVEFDMDVYTRPDLETRINAELKMVQAGIRTPNEIRKLENINVSEEPNADRLWMASNCQLLDYKREREADDNTEKETENEETLQN